MQKQATQQKEETKSTQLNQAQMMQKKFEFENEVIEEELYQFSEAEIDRMFEEKPWAKEWEFNLIISIF